MNRRRLKKFSKYLFLIDTSLSVQERLVSPKGLDEAIAYSAIVSKRGISIDPAYDEIISEHIY